MTRDVRLLFATRIVRLFAFGSLSIILVLFLVSAGLSEPLVGLLFTLALAGDTALSLLVTTVADRLGRRRMLMISALGMILAGVLFALTRSFPALLLAATIGVVSPSGNEVGPFLAIEQAALSEEVSADDRVRVFAWYNLVGSFATAFGALLSGVLVRTLATRGFAEDATYRVVVLGYAALGGVMLALFASLGPAAEPPAAKQVDKPPAFFRRGLGLGPSRGAVARLAMLFTLDSFAGGFVVQAFVAYWFHARHGVPPATLGAIFFGANIVAGCSALAAARVAKRFGLLPTMIVTHLPSNILLLLVPLMPSLPLAITMLLLRFSISQMDVPTRQAYTMALVAPDERSAAAGITGIARTLGAALAPLVAGPLFATAALSSVPFFVAGGVKIVYDLLLWRFFQGVALPKETKP